MIINDKILKKYPEVYHYTDRNGFTGIMSTNTLWATYYEDSNDTTEVYFLREKLIDAITISFAKILKENPYQTVWRRDAAPGLARDLVDTFYGISGEAPQLNLMMDKPFITCFCTHVDAYDKQHGLLSQWRGYGGDGGYCIIFDTERLSQILDEERRLFQYVDINISPVLYDNDNLTIETVFSNLISNSNVFLQQTLEDNYTQPYGDLFTPFIEGATHFKHRAFREEAEIRLVALPRNKTRSSADFEFNKTTYIRNVNSYPIRYIILFENHDITLPINRVIIGPSQHQSQNAEFARKLLDSSIPVVCSETPYLPSHIKTQRTPHFYDLVTKMKNFFNGRKHMERHMQKRSIRRSFLKNE